MPFDIINMFKLIQHCKSDDNFGDLDFCCRFEGNDKQTSKL